MFLERPNARYVSTVTHEGKVLLMVTAADETGVVRLYYAVKQDGFEDTALQKPNGNGWEAFKRLELPNDSRGDQSVATKEKAELTDKQGNHLLRSIYDSDELTADAPTQLVSHDGHVYVFRQSTRGGTLLVDRFVLDGMTNTLTPKLEVRFKRSRQRYKPLKDMKITSGGRMESVDSLDFRDMVNEPFFEPTIEVCPNLLKNLHDGWFGVVVTPTNEQESFRWHIFAHDEENKLNLVTLASGDDGIFNVQDLWFRAVDPVTDQVKYDNIPGIIRRQLALTNEGPPLTVIGGPAVTAYDVQRERQTTGGPQLMREASKVLLAVPTTAGTATLSFAIAADGRLAQISADSKDDLLRSQEREILLPIDLLASIRPVGDGSETPAGTIIGISRSASDDSADRVRVQVSPKDNDAVSALGSGDTVKLHNTSSYNGLYTVSNSDGGSFEIDAPFKNGALGDWEKVEEEETGLIFDGMLTGYEKSRDGKLKVYAVNHGLAVGDLVQIVGDGDYGGEYPVLKHDDDSFTVERLWAGGEALNVKLESRKRRGLVLDGERDWISATVSQAINLSGGFTVETWVKLANAADQTILLIQSDPQQADNLADAANAPAATLALKDGRFSLSVTRPLLDRTSDLRITSDALAPLDEWLHVACSFDGQELHLLENGAIKACVTAKQLDSRAKVAQDDVIKQLEQDVALLRPGRDADTARAALDALKLRLKQVPPAFSIRGSAVYLGATPQLKSGSVQPTKLLKGQLADVRLWTAGRSDRAIVDAMHLQLTGRETGLAGSWRLGGIAVDDDGGRRVFDFSVYANHGAVQGAPYAGGVVLGRTLRDGTTAAVKFGNGNLVAVREGAIYVESFEFRTDKRVDPANADGKGGVIFAPSLWGRLSRNSQEKQAFKPIQENFEFEKLGDGWQRATCRFLIPEGVRLLRCFEVAGVAGDWKTLEVRRNTVRLVSDTVTLSTLDETARLPLLAKSLDNPAQPADLLSELAGKEDEEASLVARQKKLEGLLADSAGNESYKSTKQRRDEQQALVDRLRSEESSKQVDYYRAAADPLNFWCTITCQHENRRVATDDRGHILNLVPSQGDHQRWKFEQVAISDGYTWYKIISKATNNCAAREDTKNGGIHQEQYTDHQLQQWRLKDDYDGFLHIINRQYKSDKFRIYNDGMRANAGDLGKYARFKLAIDGEAINGKPSAAQNALELARQQRMNAEVVLAGLNTTLGASDSERAAWNKELTDVLAKLAAIRDRMAALTTQYLNLVTKAQSTAQAMPDLPGQEDPRGLLVQGALLPFARPAGRLHAFESCTGHVTLSYKDAVGNLRQTHYDTAYDADGKGEEWLPDGYRAALELDGRGSALTLPAAVFDDLSSQVTVEFWAKGGSDLPKASISPLLGLLDENGERRLCIQLPNEKGEVVWEAGRLTNGALDSLVQVADATLYRGDWNHWAFVKDAAAGEMRIYLNGKLWKKNDPKANKDDGDRPRSQLLGGIARAALGGLPGQQGGWQGKVCELRIWNVALGEREIEANSVLTLNGNEPGLVAYYPLSEGERDQGRDHTGGGHPIATGGAAWAACTAPIGRVVAVPTEAAPVYLLSRPQAFDGSRDFVQLPALNLDFGQGLTIEARVTFQSFKRWSRIIDLGNGSARHNILLANDMESKRLRLEIYDDQGKGQEIVASKDLPDRQTTHIAATLATDGQARLYINGEEVAAGKIGLPVLVQRTSNYIGKSNWPTDELFHGQMDYVRLYSTALGAVAIKELAGCGNGAVICAEYSRVRVDAQRRKSVMMLRCLALPTGAGLRLLDEQRIEDLEMTWVGNAQIKPTLIGYIEGPPPVPSENLTEEEDYNGATSVELVQSSEVEYSWTREGEVAGGAELEVLVGAKSETSAGLIVQTSVEEIKTGFGGKSNFGYHWQNASSVGASHSLMSSDRLELRGTQEPEANFPDLGKRFIPKNIGYALVSSGLADVFAKKLKRSGRMIGYQVLPVEGVPLDVNTITFLINPAYTMSGSLDGLTGSRATSNRLFQHVPEMRSQYGSLYPASYFRLKEAYDLKNQIDQQDKSNEAYFNQFNARLLDVLTLDHQVDDTSQDGGPIGIDSPDRRGDDKELAGQIKNREAELETLKNAKPVDQKAVDAKQKELDALKAQETDRKKQGQGQRKEDAGKRQGQINSAYTDLSARANASDSFAAWQRKMETLQIRAGKRNIVNTYVWDGDGGFHAEEQQSASTVEHTVGGSFDLSVALGGQGSFAFTKVLVEGSAYATFNLTQTMSKTEHSSKGLELHCDLSGMESRGITDYRDRPILPGEKVDRYRFMSFFLEPNADHWHDFFNYVVDPEWLVGNDEEARALREAQSALPNKVWRVFHRVTYVERPALMGFGRAPEKKDEPADDIRALRDQVTDLQGKVAALRNEIIEKLDQLERKT